MLEFLKSLGTGIGMFLFILISGLLILLATFGCMPYSFYIVAALSVLYLCWAVGDVIRNG